jgi:hypothetical protein
VPYLILVFKPWQNSGRTRPEKPKAINEGVSGVQPDSRACKSSLSLAWTW